MTNQTKRENPESKLTPQGHFTPQTLGSLTLRETVIFLYTKGKMLCNCGSKPTELHHTNPKDGRFEDLIFGSEAGTMARQYQIKMFAKNPNYILPLCHQCHNNIHGRGKNRTHCKHGHELTKENTYTGKKRGNCFLRECRICNRKNLRKFINKKNKEGL